MPTQPIRPPSTPDDATVDACRRGDRAALGTVFHACSPSLEGLLTRLLGPTADVEDVLQQTFMAAIAAFPRFRGEASVRTWLGKIAVNQAYEAMRKPHVKRRARFELVADHARVDHAGPDRVHEARRRLERLHVHLSEISPKQRIAFVLHVIEGHPMDEVAALMDANTAATKSRVMWARRALLGKARRDPLLCDLLSGGDS